MNAEEPSAGAACNIAYLLVVWLWLAVCQVAYSAPANGDFELGTTASWSIWNPANQPFQWGVSSDPSKVHSGTYAGALTQFGGTTNVLQIISSSASLSGWPANALCLGTLYLKTVNLQTVQGLGVVMVFLDSLGTIVG